MVMANISWALSVRSVLARAEGQAPGAQQQVDIDAEVEQFMKRQAELESGGKLVV
jgi:hypothetical protein